MTKNELRQKMVMCIATLKKLTGKFPTADELISALGNEYEVVLAEYFTAQDVLTVA